MVVNDIGILLNWILLKDQYDFIRVQEVPGVQEVFLSNVQDTRDPLYPDMQTVSRQAHEKISNKIQSWGTTYKFASPSNTKSRLVRRSPGNTKNRPRLRISQVAEFLCPFYVKNSIELHVDKTAITWELYCATDANVRLHSSFYYYYYYYCCCCFPSAMQCTLVQTKCVRQKRCVL